MVLEWTKKVRVSAAAKWWIFMLLVMQAITVRWWCAELDLRGSPLAQASPETLGWAHRALQSFWSRWRQWFLANATLNRQLWLLVVFGLISLPTTLAVWCLLLQWQWLRHLPSASASASAKIVYFPQMAANSLLVVAVPHNTQVVFHLSNWLGFFHLIIMSNLPFFCQHSSKLHGATPATGPRNQLSVSDRRGAVRMFRREFPA